MANHIHSALVNGADPGSSKPLQVLVRSSSCISFIIFENVCSRAVDKFSFSIGKRQKFVIAIALLTLGLFFGEFQFNRFGIAVAFTLAIFTNIFFFYISRG